MSKFCTMVGLAVMLAAIGSSSAAATTGPAMTAFTNPIGPGSNTATFSGSSVSSAGPTFDSLGVSIRCASNVNHVTTVTTATFIHDQTYNTCTVFLAGMPITTATGHPRCPVTMSWHNATYNDATGGTTGGTVTTHCTFSFTYDSGTCTLHLQPQTREGIFAQNVNQNGSNTAAAHPWGVKIFEEVNYTHTTTGTCDGLPEHAMTRFSGSMYIHNLWFTL